MPNDDEKFYTLTGYAKKNEEDISATMEDYLEMIFRIERIDKYVRINSLASKLNVAPSSASKMVGKLKEHGLIEFQPYGIIQQTSKGWEMGKYLFYRHDLLNQFFCLINQSSSELELVEKIEHYIDKKTIENISNVMPIIKKAQKSTKPL